MAADAGLDGEALRRRLGSLNLEDYSCGSLEQAHRALGVSVGPQARRALSWLLAEASQAQFQRRLEQVRNCRGWMERCQRAAQVSGRLRAAIGEYLASLEAWSAGAELAEWVQAAGVGGHAVAGLSAAELGLLLQHDNTAGCQTGLYRRRDGGIILWHSEEDADREHGSRFDRMRIAEFADGSVRLYAFIYPDLLPGPAFGWRSDGYVQAVDSLILHNPPECEHGALANAAAWLAWRLGPALPLSEILQALQPFYDGYAINAAWLESGRAQGMKIEFAGDRSIAAPLPELAGEFTFQVNLFCQRRDHQLGAWEDLPPESKTALMARLHRTRRMVRRAAQNGTDPGENFFWRLLGSSAGGDWSYRNKDVKASLLARLGEAGLELWACPGPALAASASAWHGFYAAKVG